MGDVVHPTALAICAVRAFFRKHNRSVLRKIKRSHLHLRILLERILQRVGGARRALHVEHAYFFVAQIDPKATGIIVVQPLARLPAEAHAVLGKPLERRVELQHHLLWLAGERDRLLMQQPPAAPHGRHRFSTIKTGAVHREPQPNLRVERHDLPADRPSQHHVRCLLRCAKSKSEQRNTGAVKL